MEGLRGTEADSRALKTKRTWEAHYRASLFPSSTLLFYFLYYVDTRNTLGFAAPLPWLIAQEPGDTLALITKTIFIIWSVLQEIFVPPYIFTP